MQKYLEYKKIIAQAESYPTTTELLYKHGFKLEDLDHLKLEKMEDSEYIKIPLYDEAEKSLLYYNNQKILNKLAGSQSMIDNAKIIQFNDIHDQEVTNGFIFSEIESSLAIENVRSTRAEIEKLKKSSYSSMLSKNDIIIKNMIEAYEYVQDKVINEENIHHLYTILSRDSLQLEEQLQDGQYYRHDTVNVIGSNGLVIDKGIHYTLLPSRMKTLLQYIKQEKTQEEHLLAPHIIHFYILYLHPYFDYNGRMARVLAYWYSLRYNPIFSLLFVNEAINHKRNKNRYYTAITNTRKANNDLTYFLEYLADIIFEYTQIYINYYHILERMKSDGIKITRSSENALKYVLALPKAGEGYFDWRQYKNSLYEDFSKVFCLRQLNQLCDLGILNMKKDKKANLYILNKSKLVYI